MSTAAIDQLFQITTPSQNERSAAQSGSKGKNLFHSHLQRATGAADEKTPPTKDVEQEKLADKDEPLADLADQEERSTASQEESVTSAEPPEKSADSSPEPTAENSDTSDEVTLSAAAAAVEESKIENSQIVAAAVLTSNVEIVVETASADDQQQPSGQFPANFVETTEGTNTAAAAIEPISSEAGLLGEEEGEATNNPNPSNADPESGEDSKQQQAPSHSNEVTTAPSTDDEAPTSEKVAFAKQQTGTSQQTHHAAETLAKDETSEKPSDRHENKSTIQTTAPASSGLVASTDTDLLTSNNADAAATPAATAAPTAAPPTGESLPIAADRAIGSALASKPTTATSGQETSDTPTVDRARFVQRVGSAIRTAQQRDGQIQLRLSPPELGSLRIQLTVQEGAITAHLETESSSTRTVLLDSLPALRERLAELDITIEKFDVDVGREGQQQTDNPSAEERQEKRRNQTNSTAPDARPRESASSETNSSTTQTTVTSGLDIRI